MLRTQPSCCRWKRCFTNDEGGSLEVGVQAQTSNYRKRRGLRVSVVNVAGKGGEVLRQVGHLRVRLAWVNLLLFGALQV